MRRTNILDVVRVVTATAPAHPEVASWWYVPAAPNARKGEEAGGTELEPPVEVVVRTVPGAAPDLEAIGSELSAGLNHGRVTVRLHREGEEGGRLYRLLTVQGEADAAS